MMRGEKSGSEIVDVRVRDGLGVVESDGLADAVAVGVVDCEGVCDPLSVGDSEGDALGDSDGVVE